MATKVAGRHRPGCGTGPDGPLHSLVRRLVSQAAHSRPENGSNKERDEDKNGIILEAEVDGVRCVLVRSAKVLAPPISLSPRELEIARMIAKGHPNKTIAAVLEISSWTVGTHLRRIFAKLGVSSRAAMVARIMESGALDKLQ